MSEEITKNLYIGDSGNKAEVVEEDRNANDEMAHYSRDLMRKAGAFHAPIGTDYLGSAVVHYYTKQGLNESTKEFFAVCQTDVTRVSEGHGDIGWKQLKAALMKSYGRSEPKTRDN
jgi:hypothetical protein